MKLIKLSLIILAMNVASCTSNTKPDDLSASDNCTFLDATHSKAPNWVCNASTYNLGIYAVGIAEKSKAGVSFMRNMAKSDALGHIAELYEQGVSKMTKQYTGVTGRGNTETVDAVASITQKTISNAPLQGAKIYKTTTDAEGRFYVLVGISKKEYNETISSAKNIIKSSVDNDSAMWQEFKAQKSHDEMSVNVADIVDDTMKSDGTHMIQPTH